MKRKHLFWIGLVFILCLCEFSVYCFAGSGKREHFLNTGPGSASVALGEALTAKGIDASAGYYNPATLINQPSSALIEYSKPNMDATRSWLSLALGEEIYKIGFLWKNETLPLSSNKNAFLMSSAISDNFIPYAPKGLSIGIMAGYVQEQVSGYSASALLTSLGVAYSARAYQFKYGIGGMLHNLYFSGLKFRDDGETEKWPVQPEIGISVSRWNITILGSIKSGDGTRQCIGISYHPFQLIELRAGMNENPRLGVGIEVKKIKVDYAMTMGKIINSNTIAVSYLWGKQEEKKDYTDPFNELEARYNSLAGSVLASIKSSAQLGNIPERSSVFKLIVSNLKSEDGWNLYENIEREKRMTVKLPMSKRAKRKYYEFAVAYVNNLPEAKELAIQFVNKYPNRSVTKLIKIILTKDMEDFK